MNVADTLLMCSTLTAWTPANLGSALKLWLEGDFGITQSGGTVSAWASKSPATINAAQATGAAQPAYTASAIGGKPGLTSGTGKTMTLSAEPVAQSAARHIFIVYGSSASDTAATTYLVKPRLGIGYGVWLSLTAAAAIETNNTTTNTRFSGSAPTGNMLLEYVFDGVTTNLMKVNAGGVDQPVQNIAGTGVDVEGAPAGCNILEACFGPCTAMLITNAVLSGSDLTNMRSYLQTKYGV